MNSTPASREHLQDVQRHHPSLLSLAPGGPAATSHPGGAEVDHHARLEQAVALDQFLQQAARERMPSACAFLTWGSEKCSLSQRWLLLLRVMRGARKGPDEDAGPAGRPAGHDTLPAVPIFPFAHASPLTNAQIRFLRGRRGAKDVTPVEGPRADGRGRGGGRSGTLSRTTS